MARRELGPASLAVGAAVSRLLPPGEAVVGCSGGADSMALALGAEWAARRTGTRVRCVVVDHGLQTGSADVAAAVAERLRARGLSAEVRRVAVDGVRGGLEAAAREARLEALSSDGRPVLLGHTMDDQAETVLLALLRGSGTRSVAGMSEARGPFLRPLLDLRRATTVQACREWGVEWWEDPHNDDERFARVRIRRHLQELNEALGRDVTANLARTAVLARMDADLLDRAARDAVADWPATDALPTDRLAGLDDALRLRVLRDWLERGGLPGTAMVHVLAVDALVTDWRGQGPIAVPGGEVSRRHGELRLQRLG